MQYHNAFSAHQYRRRELRRKVRMGNNAGDEIITFKSGLETALDLLLLLVFELCTHPRQQCISTVGLLSLKFKRFSNNKQSANRPTGLVYEVYYKTFPLGQKYIPISRPAIVIQTLMPVLLASM